MLSRRALAARPLQRAIRPASLPTRQLIPSPSCRIAQLSTVTKQQPVLEDAELNGNYENPPAIKRSLRDPYGDYFDKQERRHWGEPVHEDNDILGVFSTEEYTHFQPGWGGVLMATFIAATLGLCGMCYLTYPDKPSVPKVYEDGLEAELGGPNALRARTTGEDNWKTL